MVLMIIAVTLLFAVINGFHDGCNVVATIVISRSMTPKRALVIACLAEFIGAALLGTAVAITIGKGILSQGVFSSGISNIHIILFSVIIAGIVWNLITWFIGLPSSSSHALVGGMVGAGVISYGFDAVLWGSLIQKVIIPLLVAPILGFVGGFIIMKLSIAIFRNHKPSVSNFFKKIQIITMCFLAASHGSNDSQKAMGIITLALLAGTTTAFSVPAWVILTCAIAISIGVSMGGWKIIKTIGKQVSKITPLHSFDSQIASGSIICLSSVAGFPVSTTQTVGSSVMGVGAGYKADKVRWAIAKDIIAAWIVTIPAAAIISAGVCLILKYVY